MRGVRIKISWKEATSRQHVYSRAVNGEFYFAQDYQKEVFCEMMWKVAEFCGLQVLTFVVMGNHFHIELHLPLFAVLSDEELLRRYQILHPDTGGRASISIALLRVLLAENGPEAQAWRNRQLAQMGDISQFMKLLKQRYSIWYNAKHERFGTLWAERYGNVLAEGKADDVTLNIGVYIDLNPVRAGLVKDPADYRFSGYGAAVRGDLRAQQGIMLLTGRATWKEAQADYRLTLFAVGSKPKTDRYSISLEQLDQVIREQGKLSFPQSLLKRTNYFRQTLVVGTREFVERQLALYRQKTGARMRRGPVPFPDYADWGHLFALRKPKRSPAAPGA